jgi:HAD superfamily hydrolase (TIGR01549 family)
MKFRNIILDVDGTLIDSKNDIINAQLFMLQHYGFHTVEPKDILPFYGKPIHELMKLYFSPDQYHLLSESVEVYRNRYREHWFDTTVVFDGVIKTLELFFSKQIFLATATTKSTSSTKLILDHFDIGKYFVQIQGTDTDMPYKPDPFIVQKIIVEQGWNSKETLLVGDTDTDICAGKNAGITTCGVTYGSLDRKGMMLCNPDFIIDHFTELSPLVGSVAA